MKAFSSAEEFLESGDLSQGACIVLDIQMRGLTGFALQEKLASKEIRIPVIAVSALDDAEIRERARKLGAAFFRKPVDGQALIDAIHWAMGVALSKLPRSSLRPRGSLARRELRGIKIQNLFPCCHSCPGFHRDKLQQESRVSREGGNPVTFCSPLFSQRQFWIPTFVGMTDEVNLL